MSVSRRSFLSAVARTGGYGATFSAMQALGLLAAGEASALPPMATDQGKGKRVVIIGAGAAGLTSAYELRNAGFAVTVLEANGRVGGRAWAAKRGTQVKFLDGTSQTCGFDEGQWFNMGPARIPSIHRNLLGYCGKLGVALEVEINTSRSALMQADSLNGGKPVTQRRVVHDSRGYIAELLAKAIDSRALDQAMTQEDGARLREFLIGFGELDKNAKYVGGERSGFLVDRGAGPATSKYNTPLPLHELLIADMSKGEFYEEHIDWQATMFQPVGGMDQIWFAFARSLGDIVKLNAPVSEISNTARGVRVAYSAGGRSQAIEADFCICTLAATQLRKMPGNLSAQTKAAAAALKMIPLYKIGWQAPRFWESEANIYGGISFLKQPVDLVWYPSYGLFSGKGVVVAGFNSETEDDGSPTAFGKLPMAAKIAESRRSVELLHPGRSNLLEHPLYMSWQQIPYFEGAIAVNEGDDALPYYTRLNEPDGNVWFAGDYLSRLVGWQEGAILSAHRAIAGMTARMKAAA